MRFLLGIFLLLGSVSAFAQSAPQDNGSYLGVTGSVPYVYTPVGYCQLSVSSSATSLSACAGGIPAKARVAFVQTETVSVRWRDDGTAPTAAVGVPLNTTQQLQYSGPLSAIQFIAQSGTTTLDVAFER